MKIFRNNAVYVQKCDLECLYSSDVVIPNTILFDFFCDGVLYVDESNRNEYVKFKSEDEVNFFRNLDWIINYDDVNGMSNEQLDSLAKKTIFELDRLMLSYNRLSLIERVDHTDFESVCRLLKYKYYTYKYIKNLSTILVPDECLKQKEYCKKY